MKDNGMTDRSYCALVLLSVVLSIGSILAVALNVSGYTGSQTRTSGFLEREFGATSANYGFNASKYEIFKTLSDYQQPVDLLVVGDSFGNDHFKGWVNWVSHELSLSAAFIHIDRVDWSELLAHEVMRREPPRYIVVASSEAMALTRLRRIGKSQLPTLDANSVVRPDWVVAKQRSAEPALVTRKIVQPPLKEQVRVASHYIAKSLQRLLGLSSTARAMEIRCDTCFSNRRKGEFLVSTSSLDKRSLKLQFRSSAVSAAKRLKQNIESNGYSSVNYVFFPNKINVYAEYAPSQSPVTIFSGEMNDDSFGLVPLLDFFKSSVVAGMTDLYLPNDHHLGSEGYRLAGQRIADVLINN